MTDDLTASESLALLDRAGVSYPATIIAGSAAEALERVGELAWPVVVKRLEPGVLHKSDTGGVVLNVASAVELATVLRHLGVGEPEPGAAERVLIQEQAADQIEVLLSVRRSAQLGTFAVLGLGGVWAEFFEPTLVRCPIDLAALRSAIGDGPLGTVLRGYRGGPAARLSDVHEVVERLALALAREPDIVEVEINPLALFSDGRAPMALDVSVKSAVSKGPPVSVPKAGIAVDQAATDALWHPKRIVVVGASANPRKVGHRVVETLRTHGYTGEIIAVNSAGSQVELASLSVRGIADIAAEPAIDLAIVATPPHVAPSALRELDQIGVAVAIVVASGFEKDENVELSRELRDVISGIRMRVIGPNSFGAMNFWSGLCATFTIGLRAHSPIPGDIALVTQSGGFGVGFMSDAFDRGVGLSCCIGTGGEFGLGLPDALALAATPQTKAIALFLEDITDWSGFTDAVGRLTAQGIPIVAYKTGRSPEGNRAVISHSARMVGPFKEYEAALRGCGVRMVDQPRELLTAAQVLASGSSAGPAAGKGVAVLSVSGGYSSVVADLALERGLSVPGFAENTVGQLERILPLTSKPVNPVDLTGEILTRPEIVVESIKCALADDAIDLVLLVLALPDEECGQVVDSLITLVGVDDRVVVCWYLGRRAMGHNLRRLRRAGLPVHETVEELVTAAQVRLTPGANAVGVSR